MDLKLSYCIAASDVLSPNVTALKGKWERNFPFIRKCGYQGIEIVIKDPDKIKKNFLMDLCNENKLSLSVVCTGEIYGEDGLSLIYPDKEVRKKTVQRMKKVIEFAAHFKAGVNIGRVRGNICKDVERKESLSWARAAFSELTTFAEKADVCLMLEPINRFQCNFINTTQEGIDMIKQVNSKYFQLMLDLFHMNIEDASIEASILESGKYLKHVHICDSNRHAPGKGHLDFFRIINALNKIGYTGYLSGEILPIPDGKTAVLSTAKYFKPIIRRVNKKGQRN